MSKSSPLHRFDAAVQAFISSRRALGRAIRLDEYVLHRLRAHRAGDIIQVTVRRGTEELSVTVTLDPPQ